MIPKYMGGSMSNPEYCAAWDIPKIFRGDTLDGFAVTARKLPSRDPIIPVAVCAHIVDSFGRVIHPMQYTIDPVVGTITFAQVDGDVTATWRAGSYAYDVEWTTANGRKRTYLNGALPIVEDRSKCQ